MKTTLKHLKELIRHFKSKECPKLSSGKAVLHKFAEEHGLLKEHHQVSEVSVAEKHEAKAEKHLELAKEAKTPAVKNKHIKKAMVEEKKAEVAEKKPVKMTKKAMASAPVMSKKEAHRETLKKVMAIRKSGKTLKEAWAEVKK
jgi:hypothetical protein